MSDGGGEDLVKRAVEMCSMAQSMIEITSKHLFGLRSQTSTDLIQQEICETESKLIKLISKQLVAKAKLKVDKVPEKLQEYPKTEQWLDIVGIHEASKKSILGRGLTLESLLEMSDSDVTRFMDRYNSPRSDINKLNPALKNLKVWTEHQLEGDVVPATDLELHWSSYKSASSSPFGGSSPKFCHHPRSSTSSLPPDAMPGTSPQSPVSQPSPPQSTPTSPLPAGERARFTPPHTPPLVKPSKGKFPTTPPPQKKNKLHPDTFLPLLTKSKSHESQLSQKVDPHKDASSYFPTNPKKPANLSLGGSHEAISSARKKSADGADTLRDWHPSSPLLNSPKRSPPHKHVIDPVTPPDVLADVHPNKKNQLTVPVSPMAPLTGGPKHIKHSINHRFTSTFKITQCDYCQKHMFLGYRCKDCKFHTNLKLVMSSCDLCRRPILLGKVCKTCKFQTKIIVGSCDYCHKHIFRGKYCKYCKSKFHRECASRAAPSCGLSNELVDIVVQSISNSPHVRRGVNHTVSLPAGEASMEHAHSMPMFHPMMCPDSSSNTSSCNSSTPSSPAFMPTPPSPAVPSPAMPSPAIQITDTQFSFPDVANSLVSTIDTMDSIGTYTEYDNISQRKDDSSYLCDVINTNTSNDSDKSDKTLVDTGSSSERTNSGALDRVDSIESTGDEGINSHWHRVNSISVVLKEWDIPYEELEKGNEIGTGRFGTVFRGNWHGDIAIKMLNVDRDADYQAQLQAFKLEIAMLRKTRHENLVLFMGACMKLPHLAIVTSYCKGPTLFTHIHTRKEKFPMNKAVIIASQIAQGMGYLHAKAIVHKDLKTKNIFLENGKVVITDFGLFNVTKLCASNRKGNWLSIPPGWLCYLAPEIMRALQARNPQEHDLPFTQGSDVYAFGTVWYELLCGEWPFNNQPPEAIIWQVGHGMKQSLGSVQASRDVKDVLMLCWAYLPAGRPDFSKLLKTLEKLPKKRLARSPSHPIQLSRSAESVF